MLQKDMSQQAGTGMCWISMGFFYWDFHGILGFSWDFKRILMCFFSSGFEWQSRGGRMILPQMRGLGAEQIVTDPVKVH